MIRTTLALTFLAGLVAASSAPAQGVVAPITSGSALNPSAGAGGIMAHKQRILTKIQERMATLQSLQSCVSAAQDATAMRGCEEQARAARGEHEKKC